MRGCSQKQMTFKNLLRGSSSKLNAARAYLGFHETQGSQFMLKERLKTRKTRSKHIQGLLKWKSPRGYRVLSLSTRTWKIGILSSSPSRVSLVLIDSTFRAKRSQKTLSLCPAMMIQRTVFHRAYKTTSDRNTWNLSCCENVGWH